MLGEDDRELDHLLGFELGRGSLVEDIGTARAGGIGRGRELEDTERRQPGESVERKLRSRVMRLVNDERPEDMAEVDEGMDGLAPIRAFGAEFEPFDAAQGREVALPAFGMRIDGTGFRVFSFEALDRRYHYHKPC
jgi:hypothetical protein